jgi:F0F1-type ATP synthase alpha subunit
MKRVAGTLRVDQAQFRELEAFSKFGSDLDAATMAVLDKGRRNVEILKQGQYSPVPVQHQVAIIYCGTKVLCNMFLYIKFVNSKKLYRILGIKTQRHITKNCRGRF